jgi:hypothetical protein
MVTLARPPSLSQASLALLQTAPAGAAAFQRRYGDYYVAAYALGADCGVLLSTDVAARESSETFSLALEAHMAILSAEWEDSESKFSSFSSMSSTVACFDTLTASAENVMGNLAGVQATGADYAKRTLALPGRFENKVALKLKGTRSGMEVGWTEVMKLGESNLVAEMVLQPFSALREYAAAVSLSQR